jgi:2'-5' RNA ligase
LGNVALDQVSALKEQVASVLKSSSPFELCAERVGAFPDIRFPRVLWVGLNDTQGELLQLHHLVEGAVSPFSPQAGHEYFHAHATAWPGENIFERVIEKRSLTFLSKMGQRSFGEWCVNEIELMRRELSSQGALHTCVASFPPDKRRLSPRSLSSFHKKRRKNFSKLARNSSSALLPLKALHPVTANLAEQLRSASPLLSVCSSMSMMTC